MGKSGNVFGLNVGSRGVFMTTLTLLAIALLAVVFGLILFRAIPARLLGLPCHGDAPPGTSGTGWVSQAVITIRKQKSERRAVVSNV